MELWSIILFSLIYSFNFSAARKRELGNEFPARNYELEEEFSAYDCTNSYKVIEEIDITDIFSENYARVKLYQNAYPGYSIIKGNFIISVLATVILPNQIRIYRISHLKL